MFNTDDQMTYDPPSFADVEASLAVLENRREVSNYDQYDAIFKKIDEKFG